MRILAIILGLLVAFPAWGKARLKLVSDRPVVIVVNLKPHPVGDNAPVSIEIPEGREGTQRVTVRNLAGQQMYSGTVVVPRDHVVTVAWRQKQLRVVDKKLMKTSDAFNRGGGTKKSPAGHKRLDELAQDDGGPTDLLSLAASSTSDEPAVPTDEAGEPLEQPIADDATDEGPPAEGDEGPEGDGSEPAETAPPTAVIAEGDGSSASRHGHSLKLTSSNHSGGAASTCVVRFVARSQSWANLWVGEEKVWEQRGEADAMDVTLPAGSHEIVVRDFRDRDIWGRGTLIIGPGQRAEVHFSKSQPIETVGGDWTPAN